MFYPLRRVIARRTTHAQIKHKARIVRGKAAKLRCRHACLVQEYFDLTQQHDASIMEGLTR